MSLSVLYKQLSRWPLGKKIFSAICCKKAPYFSSISPLVSYLDANKVIIMVKKRRKVLNHLQTIHAIAMCNAGELAAGLLMESGLPKHLRWIPKKMEVSYLKKAETSISATAVVPDWSNIQLGDNAIGVEVRDANHILVVSITITMWISEKKLA